MIFVTVGAALVAVIITGLAIIVSTSDNTFVSILKKKGIYNNILFPFWFSAVIAGMSIVFNCIFYIMIIARSTISDGELYKYSGLAYSFSVFLSFFFVFYALFLVIALIENALKYGLYRGAFLDDGRNQSDKE